MLKKAVLIAILFSLPFLGISQQDSTDITFVPLPAVFFTPETSWGFGGAAFLSWRFKGNDVSTRPSQIQVAAAYTLEDQILLYIPFQLWFKDEEYSVFGELGWYRYNYFFFGIGNSQPSDFRELYGVDFPRVRLTGIKEIRENIYLGGRFIMDDFEITELDPEGQLANLPITGNQGGLNTGIGAAFIYDSRDNYIETFKGWYTELTLDVHGGYIGSDFDYSRLRLDVRKFFEISKKDHLATRFFSESIFGGAAPFISQALLGGPGRMRGFYLGRYRDDSSMIVQAEYRRKLFWRLGLTVFGAAGAVDQSISDISVTNTRFTYGTGLRLAINPEERINIRFDVGVGDEVNFYITIGEAF